MARHEIVIHENTGATKTAAPYLGSYISKETLALAQFASAVGGKCGLPAIQVIAILGGAFEAIEALEREALVRVHTDIGVVCGVITGSFPTADAPFDPARNALELALRLDDALRLDLTDTVPAIVTDADLTRLRVDNVMDLEVKRPMNLIHGQHVFRVAGFNMVLSDEGAAVYLENALGTTFPLVVDEVVSKQLFKAHTAELLEGGDYKLVVKSRAGDAAGPLQTSFRRVKYLSVGPVGPVPTLTEGHSQAHEAETGKMFPQFAFILSGANLGDASVHLKYVGQSGTAHDEEISADNYEISEDGTELVIGPGGIVNATESTQVGDTVTVEATTAGGTASYDAEHAVNE